MFDLSDSIFDQSMNSDDLFFILKSFGNDNNYQDDLSVRNYNKLSNEYDFSLDNGDLDSIHYWGGMMMITQ